MTEKANGKRRITLNMVNDATTDSYSIDLTHLVDYAIEQGVRAGSQETMKELGRRLVSD